MLYLIIGVLTGLLLIAVGCTALGVQIGQARLERIMAADRLYRAMRAVEPYQPSEIELSRAGRFPVDTGNLPILSRVPAAVDNMTRHVTAANARHEREVSELIDQAEKRLGRIGE